MEEVKTSGEYTIYKKKNGRYLIKAKDGSTVNGKKKSEILFSEKLISVQPPQEEAPVVEAPTAEAEEGTEAPAAEAAEAPKEEAKEEAKEENGDKEAS